MSGGFPRWLGVGFTLLAIGAIVAGAPDDATPVAVAGPVHFDTAFVRANGFMMDSLRLGRDHAAPSPHRSLTGRSAAHAKPAPHDTLARRDSTLPLRYSPRGCMPE